MQKFYIVIRTGSLPLNYEENAANTKPDMQSIWKRETDIAKLNAMADDTMVSHRGIEIIEIAPDALTGTMPVESHTHQPLGMLHGGAAVALAETLEVVSKSSMGFEIKAGGRFKPEG